MQKSNLSKLLLITLTTIFVGTFLCMLNPQTAKAWNCGDALVDSRDSKSYSTVLIGTQCWMKENMNIGTKITSCTNGYAGVCTTGGDTVKDQGTDCPSAVAIEKYCHSDSEANCTTYGGFYQWGQAMCGSTTEGAQGICPTGWHIPTDAEQYTLENYLKDSGQTCNASRSGAYDCATAGTKLKSGAGGTSGFNGLLAGRRSTGGSFVNLSLGTDFWSSLQSDTSAWYRYLSSGTTVGRGLYSKTVGFSVRCLQNPNTAPSISAGPSDGSSSIVTPTNVGSNVAFTTTATDTESDNYYLAICKTNSITANNNSAPTCGGGNWCVSTSTTSASEASCNYTTQLSDSASNNWYAFVCDYSAGSLCSASSQGLGVNGSPFVINFDLTAPITTALATSNAINYTFNTWTNANVEITLTCDDASGVGCNSSYPKYCLDTTNICNPTTEGTSYTTPITISTEGTSYIRYYSQDTISNIETIKSQTIKIDKTSPIVSAGQDQTKSAQFTQTGTVTDTNGSGIASYLWEKVSTPGTITFGSIASVETTICKG